MPRLCWNTHCQPTPTLTLRVQGTAAGLEAALRHVAVCGNPESVEAPWLLAVSTHVTPVSPLPTTLPARCADLPADASTVAAAACALLSAAEVSAAAGAPETAGTATSIRRFQLTPPVPGSDDGSTGLIEPPRSQAAVLGMLAAAKVSLLIFAVVAVVGGRWYLRRRAARLAHLEEEGSDDEDSVEAHSAGVCPPLLRLWFAFSTAESCWAGFERTAQAPERGGCSCFDCCRVKGAATSQPALRAQAAVWTGQRHTDLAGLVFPKLCHFFVTATVADAGTSEIDPGAAPRLSRINRSMLDGAASASASASESSEGSDASSESSDGGRSRARSIVGRVGGAISAALARKGRSGAGQAAGGKNTQLRQLDKLDDRIEKRMSVRPKEQSSSSGSEEGSGGGAA